MFQDLAWYYGFSEVSILCLASDAIFSPCKRYRYTLMREWFERATPRMIAFLMLNPSRATAAILDPTVTRCMIRAQRMGFDGFHVVNLFAWRSTDPGGLGYQQDPIGPDNDQHILRIAQKSEIVICAWGGASPLVPARAAAVVAMLRAAEIKLHALKLNADGQPSHPLYLPFSMKPFEWAPLKPIR